MYRKIEVKFTQRSSGPVSAKASFQNSHNSHPPARETAVRICEDVSGVGGWVSLVFWGFERETSSNIDR